MTTRLMHVEPDEWQLSAACRGRSDLYFPPDYLESKIERRRREATAKTICQSCGVLAQCRDAAMSGKERFGIWGGLTERERRAMFARLRGRTPQDIAGPVRPSRLRAAAAQGRPMPSG